MAQQAPATPIPAVGTRIAYDSSRGTIRYVGPVPPTKGIWLGVEWDDVERGKHDGVHDGVRYFECRVPNSGSFIRLTSKVSFGSSFLRALRYKYIDDKADTDAGTANGGTDEKSRRQYSRKNLADIEIETPNMEGVRRRMAQLNRLRDVGLGGWKMEADPEAAGTATQAVDSYGQVAKAFDEAMEKPGDIRDTCPNVQWLDLSRSLLQTWKELALITVELPLLDTLSLHFNRFAPLETSSDLPAQAFERLRDLRLDGTLITWPEVCALSHAMPALDQLQLGANRLIDLAEGTEARFDHMHTLNLESNLIADWSSLMKAIQVCPHLRRLVLSDNRFTSIPKAPPTHKRNPIQHLSLAGNALASWQDLDNAIDWFEELTSLVITPENCAFLEGVDVRDIRPLIIARLATLTSLNNAAIGQVERRDAELFCISTVEKKGDITHWPRYAELCAKHGREPLSKEAQDNAASVVKQASTLRGKLLPVPVRLSTNEPSPKPPFTASPTSVTSSGADGATTINLLVSTPLRLLLAKIARTFKLPKGAKSIVSVWALLKAEVDPLQFTAVQLRQELRPDVERGDEGESRDERIVYQLDNLDWDLSGYNFSPGDELVIVIDE